MKHLIEYEDPTQLIMCTATQYTRLQQGEDWVYMKQKQLEYPYSIAKIVHENINLYIWCDTKREVVQISDKEEEKCVAVPLCFGKIANIIKGDLLELRYRLDCGFHLTNKVDMLKGAYLISPRQLDLMRKQKNNEYEEDESISFTITDLFRELSKTIQRSFNQQQSVVINDIKKIV